MASPVSAPFTLPDRYRLDGPVASGGMASVWAAHDTVLDRPVAVKVLAEHLGEDVAARERFQREARAAAALSSHPSVVTIFDVGAHDGRSFIVMELLRGGTVADVIRAERSVAHDRAIRWLRSAAEALDAAHAAGVVHRDIKPANLLLDEHDRLAVADFGIARLAYEDQVTATGQILGTAAYISPEQAEGRPSTEASDRYALAVVAFELLTGERPFQAEHFAAQARAHIEDPPPRASERAPLPRAVDEVLLRGLAKDPAQRWPTAAAFVDALAEALEDRTQVTVPLGDGGRPREEATRPMAIAAPLPDTPTPVPRAAAAAPPRRVEPRRVPPPPPAGGGGNRALWALGALLAAVVAIALIASALGGDGEETASQEPARSTPTAEATREPTREPTPEPTEAAAAAPSGDARALNDQGFSLNNQGKYAEAVPVLRQAVEACGDSTAMDPCGYALYNLGVALNRSGDPAAAIPILERRLESFGDNEAGDVQQELDDARSRLEGGEEGAGNGKGKGRGKGKKDD